MGQLFSDINSLLNSADPNHNLPRYTKFNRGNLQDMIIAGLVHWRSSPSLNSLLDFHTSSMVVSGDAYLEDVYRTVSGYQSTHLFDILNEGPNCINENSDPFKFNLSAIDKMRSILDSNGKKHLLTEGFAAIDAVSGPSPINYYFSSTISKLTPKLDVISIHPYGDIPYFMKWMSVNDGLAQLAVSSGKPIVGNEGGFGGRLQHINGEVSGFGKLNFGFSLFDAMVDRPLGGEPFLANDGLFFADGQTRDLKAVKQLQDLAISHGWLKSGQLNKNIKEKVGSLNNGLDGGYSRDFVYNYNSSSLNESDHYVLHKHPLGITTIRGYNNSILQQKIYNGNPMFVSGATNYTPFPGSIYSLYDNNVSIVNEKKHFDYYLNEVLLNWSSLPPLSGFGANDVSSRNQAYVDRLFILNTIYLLFPPTLGGLSKYGTAKYKVPGFDLELVSDANYLELSSIHERFNSPLSGIDITMTVNSVYQYLCSSTIAARGAPLNSAYLKFYDKPKCFYLRKYSETGSCLYNPDEQIDPVTSTYQNVYSKLDFAAYDLELSSYANSLRKCVVEVINSIEDGLVPDRVSSIISSAYREAITPKSFYPLRF